MQNEATIRITVAPAVPADIIEDTFEGRLLGAMASLRHTDGAYEVSAIGGIETMFKPRMLMDAAEASHSRLATAMLPVIRQARAEGDLVSLDDMAKAIGTDSFDIEHLLQEICRLHEDRIPHFEIQWTVAGQASLAGGRTGSGAQFVTAEGIKTLSVTAWLKEQRGYAAHDLFQTKIEWDYIDGGGYYQFLPHTRWEAVVGEHAQDMVTIERMDSGFEVDIRLCESGGTVHVGSYPSLAEAMRVGGRLVADAEATSESRLMASMGLAAGEWEVEDLSADGLHLSSLAHPGFAIIYDPLRDGGSDIGHFRLVDINDEVIASATDPAELSQHLPGCDVAIPSPA